MKNESVIMTSKICVSASASQDILHACTEDVKKYNDVWFELLLSQTVFV